MSKEKAGGEILHQKLFPHGKDVCPRDCPDRCADPNCHNVKTCARWAEHMADREREYAMRKKIAEKRRRPYDESRR